MQALRGVAANYFYQAEPEKAQPFRTSGGKAAPLRKVSN